MLYVDIPTDRDLDTLNRTRSDVCVSIYLPTTPITQDVPGSRIAFGTNPGIAWVPWPVGSRSRT